MEFDDTIFRSSNPGMDQVRRYVWEQFWLCGQSFGGYPDQMFASSSVNFLNKLRVVTYENIFRHKYNPGAISEQMNVFVNHPDPGEVYYYKVLSDEILRISMLLESMYLKTNEQ